MKRVATYHPDWTGFLLLSEDDDTVLHEGPSSRGRYLREGDRLVVNWEQFPPDEFIEVEGIFTHRALLIEVDGETVKSDARDESFEAATMFLLALANYPTLRRKASLGFDAGLAPYIGDGNLLPCINCFYEVIRPDAQHHGLLAAISSMRTAGHPVRVWSYSPQQLNFLSSEGVELAPAAQVVPEVLFRRVLEGTEIRYFSDLFRYALLCEQGGVWMDTDVVLLRPSPYIGTYFFNLQWRGHGHRICGNVLAAPPRSSHFRRLYEAALDCLDAPGARGFGEIGPKLLTDYVFSDAGAELRGWVFSPMCFNAIDWSETALFDQPIEDLKDYLNDERVFGVHLWNLKTDSKERKDDNSIMSVLSDTRRHLPSFVEIAERFNTDKNSTVGNRHFYSRIYQALLSPQRFAVRRLLEIGLCRGRTEGWSQNETPSVDLWRSFFPFCTVIGVDIEDFSQFHSPRFTSHICDQSDPAQVARVAASIEPCSLDVIIDDGSHASYDQQITFRALFPRLAPGGWYFIEDLDWQPPGENPGRVALTKDLFASLREGRTGELPDPEGLAALLDEMSQILFFDSHFELCHRGLRGGLLAVRRCAGTPVR